MSRYLSIIIPNYNGIRTIGRCLEAICAVPDEHREIIVVDDCSVDGSPDIIKAYPCALILLEKHGGASAARNAGAKAARGEILFFTDADCLLQPDTLAVLRDALSRYGPDAVLGGTYTTAPADPGFFSAFQSVFINYSETKNIDSPDYIATHAMAIHAETFGKAGGFVESFLPILEDVEFCHRLRAQGCRLVMVPGLHVRHIFNFSFAGSMRNAVRKTEYWIEYSLSNRDLMTDSGTASREMKVNGVCWLVSAGAAITAAAAGRGELLWMVPVCSLSGIAASRRLISAFHRTGGWRFALAAAGYYLWIYPAAIWTGVLRGLARWLSRRGRPGNTPAFHRTAVGKDGE